MDDLTRLLRDALKLIANRPPAEPDEAADEEDKVLRERIQAYRSTGSQRGGAMNPHFNDKEDN
jgi:hypothetical protein